MFQATMIVAFVDLTEYVREKKRSVGRKPCFGLRAMRGVATPVTDHLDRISTGLTASKLPQRCP